jgi:hypothetical protein
MLGGIGCISLIVGTAVVFFQTSSLGEITLRDLTLTMGVGLFQTQKL